MYLRLDNHNGWGETVIYCIENIKRMSTRQFNDSSTPYGIMIEYGNRDDKIGFKEKSKRDDAFEKIYRELTQTNVEKTICISE